jgi:hypothetical protein
MGGIKRAVGKKEKLSLSPAERHDTRRKPSYFKVLGKKKQAGRDTVFSIKKLQSVQIEDTNIKIRRRT